MPFGGRSWNLGGRKQPVLSSRRRSIRHRINDHQLQRGSASSGGSRPAAAVQTARFVQHRPGSDSPVGKFSPAYFFRRQFHSFIHWRRTGDELIMNQIEQMIGSFFFFAKSLSRLFVNGFVVVLIDGDLIALKKARTLFMINCISFVQVSTSSSHPGLTWLCVLHHCLTVAEQEDADLLTSLRETATSVSK